MHVRRSARRGPTWVALLCALTGCARPTPASLPAPPPGTALAVVGSDQGDPASPATVSASLRPVLPVSGLAYVVIDCLGATSASVRVRRADGRAWRPAVVASGATSVTGACDPAGKRTAYAVTGRPGRPLPLVVSGGPSFGYRVTVSDTSPNHT